MQITHCSDRDFDSSCSNSESDFEFHDFVSFLLGARLQNGMQITRRSGDG